MTFLRRPGLEVRLVFAFATLFGVGRAADLSAVFEEFVYAGSDARFDAPLAAGEYRNPILAGFYPDPSICRVGSDYYLANSSFTYFPGIPIFQSRDLVHWRQLGHVISRRTQADFTGLTVSRGVFAPALAYHDGIFYLVTTLVDCGGNCVFTARDPAGPWSDPIFLPGVDGIDSSLFFDSDGSAWLVNNGPPPDNLPLYDGHRAIWLQQFDSQARRLVGPRTIIVNGGTDLRRKPVWIEAPHLLRRGNRYYLICAEGGTAENHSEVVFRAGSVHGPWEPYAGNPILTQRDLPPGRPDPISCTGHADFTEGPDGREWAVFLGCRPYEGNRFNTGRETFLLPVSWPAGGWPVILPPGQAIAPIGQAPVIAATAGPEIPLTGNFEWRDDFHAAALATVWNTLRAPSDGWCSLEANPGALTLQARPVTLDGHGTPSFIGRRQQHTHFTVSTTLRLPEAQEVSAGIVAFQNETHFFFLGVHRRDSAAEVFLERAAGGKAEVVARAKLPPSVRIEVQISSDGPRDRFAYRASPGDWTIVRDGEDGSILSTEIAGGFVGTTLGLYARLDP